MLRILHTADWHLGHSLHDQPRVHEHERFLSWLLGTIESEAIDALIIAGDVFDAANPPARAEAMWFEFLADARARSPELDIVVIGGNHDSPLRLGAPAPVLGVIGTHVVGGLARTADGELDIDRMVFPITDASGAEAAFVAALPFLRPADLPPAVDDGDRLIRGVREIYRRVLEAATERCDEGQALITTGHCYMVGTAISELSERRILGGNQHALPVDIFPEQITYAALGHLHKAQRVGGRESVRYAGSPIPLSLSEARYRHQVLIAEIDGRELREVRSLVVPRSVEIIRVPASGSAPLSEILGELLELEDEIATGDRERPFLEIRVLLERPEPGLRNQIDAALRTKRARLCKITAAYTGDGVSLAEAQAGTDLADVDPLEVFLRRYRRDHEGDPSAELLAAFHELLEEAESEVGA